MSFIVQCNESLNWNLSSPLRDLKSQPDDQKYLRCDALLVVKAHPLISFDSIGHPLIINPLDGSPREESADLREMK